MAGRPFTDPAEDETALAAGQPVAVTAFRLDGGVVGRGLVVLRSGPPAPDSSGATNGTGQARAAMQGAVEAFDLPLLPGAVHS